MKTTAQGKVAEAAVAEILASDGFSVLGQNWKTRFCEIDVIAKKDKVVYFIEVKYRSHDKQGSGLEYITPQKQRQIIFSAQIWNMQNDWEGDWRLIAAEVSGDEPYQVRLVEI